MSLTYEQLATAICAVEIRRQAMHAAGATEARDRAQDTLTALLVERVELVRALHRAEVGADLDTAEAACIPDPLEDRPTEGHAARLEELRAELRAERISTGGLLELQGLAAYIEPGDVELLEAGGVPEHEDPEATYAGTLHVRLEVGLDEADGEVRTMADLGRVLLELGPEPLPPNACLRDERHPADLLADRPTATDAEIRSSIAATMPDGDPADELEARRSTDRPPGIHAGMAEAVYGDEADR